MKIKIVFRDKAAPEVNAEGGVTVRERLFWVYPHIVGDPENPDVDLYPMDTISRIEIREEDTEREGRRKVVQIDRDKN